MSGHKIGWFLKILFSYLLLTGILIACVGLPVIQNIRSLVREEILDSADRALEAVGDALVVAANLAPPRAPALQHA